MPHKTKYIDVYKKYKEKGLILLSTIYTNNRIPMNCIDKNGKGCQKYKDIINKIK